MLQSMRGKKNGKPQVKPVVFFNMRLTEDIMRRVDHVVEHGGLAGERFDCRADLFRQVVERYLDRVDGGSSPTS